MQHRETWQLSGGQIKPTLHEPLLTRPRWGSRCSPCIDGKGSVGVWQENLSRAHCTYFPAQQPCAITSTYYEGGIKCRFNKATLWWSWFLNKPSWLIWAWRFWSCWCNWTQTCGKNKSKQTDEILECFCLKSLYCMCVWRHTHTPAYVNCSLGGLSSFYPNTGRSYYDPSLENSLNIWRNKRVSFMCV